MDSANGTNIRYLTLLSEKYPTIAAASTEIINLKAILNLPKGTEHVLSDIHGEAEQFLHILKNGSGAVRGKIDDAFGNSISIRERRQLATIIYYPEEKLNLIEESGEDMDAFYRTLFNRLLAVCRKAQTKYTRSKVRKAMPDDYRYILEELIYEQADVANKEAYYNEIVNTIIRLGRAKDFTVALCELIQRLVIDHLHIVGDIYDRGPGPVTIMDRLMSYHSVDIQWGNHDALWMGAAAGNPCSIANVVRISTRYSNLDVLEDEYGINLMPLANFAASAYADDPCSEFNIKHVEREEVTVSQVEERLEEKMHKAISIIQFKVEGQAVLRHPEFNMDNRLLLDKIDYEKGTINIDGKVYELTDKNFPTIDPKDPYKLTEEEKYVVDHLIKGFKNCEKLQQHIGFLFKNGSIYLCYNNNLYYHGCIPLNADGTFRDVVLNGKTMHGKALYDFLEEMARKGYYRTEGSFEKQYGLDILWYIWSSPDSPLFGKDKMTTFERYFIAEEETHVEVKDPYYKLIDKEETCDMILREFNLDPKHSHIVNGHMPVKVKKGENPIKGNGKLFIIDGGFSKAYQKTTGIAGYTLIYNSYGLKLVTHKPFRSLEAAIKEETDIHSDINVVQLAHERKLVANTDQGMKIKQQIEDLEALLEAYRNGEIREKI
ncbi:MAG: fructose-1,6-bisphosphatase [Lachnospiraceae bacterium]|nr:fructose-1,6-bisphosphatase [Lachnospiraceae bacterium]